MASKDSKELLTNAVQPENVENDEHEGATLTAIDKKGEDILTVGEDDETNEQVDNEGLKPANMAEEFNVISVVASESTVEASTIVVDGKINSSEGGGKDVGNDKKVETINSSSKEIKKVVRKRKMNGEEVSPQAVSSSSKVLKKKVHDTSAVKIVKEETKKDPKSDEKIESGAIPEDDEKEKSAKEAKKVVNKVVKKKIVPKAKGTISNSDLAPTKSQGVAAAAATSSIPAVKKDEEGTKDNSSVDAGKLNNADKPSPSTTAKPLKKADDAEKQSKKVDGMGLVFICNAKTKKDCFKYNVLGLPKSKKDLVAKIYKGMRLFLFDVDLKLMYGIYKAAGPGGYNIEAKAFDSKFPSQVRFTVLKDCLPLPEEKFKIAIKENYYKRNQFDSKLSAEQVKNLCKLFQSATGNAPKQTHRTGAVREATAREVRRPVGRYARQAYVSPPRARYLSPPPRARYLSPPPRARYLSPPPRGLPIQRLPQALPHSYAYDLPADDYYRRDRSRALEHLEYQDPYVLYRDPARYPEPTYPPALPPSYAARFLQPRSPPRYLY